MTEATIDVLLAFADDEHLMGQQHTEWVGVAPFLEEDLAFSSIGQDELGHAVLLYEEVLRLRGIEPTDLAVDELAFRREDHDYRSCALVEFTTTNWAEALVRHWIYDTVEAHRWSYFARSSREPLREIAAAALREEAYHRRHADALLDVLLSDPVAKGRIHDAFNVIAPLVPSLLKPASGEGQALAAGTITGSMTDLAHDLATAVAERFDEQVALPSGQVASRTERSSDFGPLMARMREVLDFDPQAIW